MMTNPDLSAYNPLILFDLDSTDLVNRALVDRTSKTPEWNPVDGNEEMTLLEAQALIAAEIMYGTNRIPDGTITGALNLLGVTVSPGEQATASVTFNLSDSLGHRIPAGTVVAVAVGDDQVQFTTDTDLTVAMGDTSGTISMTSVDNTAEANGITAGTALIPISAIPYVDTAVLATDVFAGADPETSSDFINRGITRFARLNDTLVKAAHFTDEALTYSQVVRATTIEPWDSVGAAATPGHVTVALLGANGAPLSSGDKATILADLQAKALINLTLHVTDPTITTVNVTASLHSLPGEDTAAVHDAVIAALGDYLSTDTWPWNATVRYNKLLNVIENVDGVDYVDTLTVPSGNVSLSGVAPLAVLGTATITVTSS
jgi:uncharacterized phage protein gp47/JayE